MQVILKEDVINLGYKDDVVTVKDGYGRNFLIPTGKAVIASESARKVLAENLKQRAHKLAKIKTDAEELAAKVIANDLNVRQTEELANNRKKQNKNIESSPRVEKNLNEDLLILCQSLSEKFGVKVTIEDKFGNGKISFYYNNMEELDNILNKIN